MSLAFAILRPANRKAINTFLDVVEYIRDDPVHARLVATENSGIASASAPLSPSGVDWDNAVIELSLEDSKLPQFPRLGWRVGRVPGAGRHNTADICVALPDNHDVAPTQGRLFLHPRSGLLILEAGPDADRPIYYLTEARKAVMMEPKQALPLTRPTTSIIIAGAEYQISYTVTEESAKHFFGPLSRFLSDWKLGTLHPAGQHYPSMTSTGFRYFDGYVSYTDLGDGTFGHVSYGIDVRTGDPVAIKEVRVRNSHERKAQCSEIHITEMLQDSPLFLHLLHSWCSKHRLAPKDCTGHDIEYFYLVSELALYDFRHEKFAHLPDDDALELFRQTLLGISDLHRRGIMHRDITRNNMMVVSTSPLRAALIDFGKAVVGDWSEQTTIGPIPTLAPEVWRKSYGHGIDLWAWAYAAAQWLGYREKPEQRNQRISELRLREIRGFLESSQSRNRDAKPRLASFAELLKLVLVWDRRERIDTRQALSHKVWLTEGEVGRTEDNGPQLKKARLEVSSQESTVPFSEEC